MWPNPRVQKQTNLKNVCRLTLLKNSFLDPSRISCARHVLLGFFFVFILPLTIHAAIDETARQIRAELMSDESLSTSAKSIKIDINDDVLRLDGPVTSEAEKIEVERTANRVAPALRIENELYIFR